MSRFDTDFRSTVIKATENKRVFRAGNLPSHLPIQAVFASTRVAGITLFSEQREIILWFQFAPCLSFDPCL